MMTYDDDGRGDDAVRVDSDDDEDAVAAAAAAAAAGGQWQTRTTLPCNRRFSPHNISKSMRP